MLSKFFTSRKARILCAGLVIVVALLVSFAAGEIQASAANHHETPVQNRIESSSMSLSLYCIVFAGMMLYLLKPRRKCPLRAEQKPPRPMDFANLTRRTSQSAARINRCKSPGGFEI